MRKVLLLLVLALALGAGAAQADNGLLYLGAGIANDNLKDVTATYSNFNSINSSGNSTNWKVWAGVRPIPLFAIEADYMDLGSKTLNYLTCIDVCPIGYPLGTHLHYKSFAGYAVGFVPIPVPYLDVFGKMGLARWTSSGGTSVAGPPGFFSLSDNGTQFAWGAGGQLRIGNLGARLEYENFSVRNTNGANLISLGVFLNLW